MNINGEEVDLGLALGSGNPRIQTRSNITTTISSGAGVNANSRAEMAFAASDPLSELVWSPHNGLSLKCTDSSSAEKKPFLLWNVGPSGKSLSTSLTLGAEGSGESDDKAEENLLDADAGFCDKATLVRSSRSSPNPELGGDHGDNGVSEEEVGNSEAWKQDNNFSGLQNVQTGDNAESSRKNDEKDVLADKTCIRDADMALDEKTATEINPVSSDIKGSVVAFLPCPNLQPYHETTTSETGEMSENKTRIPLPAPPFEFSAENDLTAKEAHGEGEARITGDNSLPPEKSPTNSRICLYREKGKGKALTDGGMPEKSSDDSHESVESCNSTGLLPKGGVKRKNYCDQEPIVKSKRIKKQNEGFFGPDSSFMNWITNMVKGLSDSHKEESSSRALALGRPVENLPEAFTPEKERDSPNLNTGFQTMFKSLYSPNNKMSKIENSFLEESSERNDNDSCKQIIVSNQEVTPYVSKDVIVRPSKPWIFSSYACESGFQENKASDMPVCDGGKVGISPSNSLCKSGGNTGLQIPLSTSSPEKSNPLNSLWITRLYTKTSNLENGSRNSQEAYDRSSECAKDNFDLQMNDVLSVERRSCDARDDEIYASKKDIILEPSLDISPVGKFIPIMPFPKRRSSEAMTSVFARRLDALRHIIPSERTNSSICTFTCFFCGGSGHDLRECPEVEEAELKDLLVKVNSFDRIEESDSMCIRCFKLDHWAVSCPLSSSKGNPSIPLKLCAGKEKCSSYISQEEEPCLGSFSSFLTSIAKKNLISNEIQKSAESYLKDGRNFPLCTFVTAQSTTVEMFHAIRKLRLSRMDILRWMKSDVPLSHLNGFFLRLRLGKMEAGLAGTGYYAACITGDMRECVSLRVKKSILVDVGGIKSSVGSQYVSNHDFLEEEIKAWWSRIVKTGGKIPSLDELNSKFNDRRSLGF